MGPQFYEESEVSAKILGATVLRSKLFPGKCPTKEGRLVVVKDQQ